MAKLVVVEGLDGCGKSRLANTLAETNCNIHRVSKWRLEWFRKAMHEKQLVKQNKALWHSFHAFSMLAMVELSQVVQRESDEDIIIACKWLATEATANELFVDRMDIPEIGLDYHAYPIQQPDLILYLKPPFDVRMERINSRDKKPNLLDKITMNHDAEEILDSYVTNFYDGKRVHVINNDQDFELTLQQAKELLSCC